MELARHVDPRPELELTRSLDARHQTILTPEALDFVARLAARFGPRRDQLIKARSRAQKRLDQGELPGFDPATAQIREGDWQVAPIPADLLDRRVEITGPPDRKMIINAMNSGARVFMADLEDSCSPTWDNLIEGQINLRDAVNGTISLDAANGRHYALGDNPATLIVRPRGLHLPEGHCRLDGKPIAGALVDAGLFLFHNAQNLCLRGSGPYLYLPKLESWAEAELWNDICRFAENELRLDSGVIRVTVLIETLPAVFAMDEILWHLRERIVGLNCGRWDYIFSYIKRLCRHSDRVLPDRAQVTMDTPFLGAYSELLIRTCHRRGAFAMGGMAAQIPIKSDPEANQQALARVRADKQREALAGHDGTWVAHPGLVEIAMEVFDQHLDGPNQLHRLRNDVEVSPEDLLRPCQGKATREGLNGNVNVAIRYLGNWLAGQGCVPINHLMEDAATAEISRAQLWQWRFHGVVLEDGSLVDDGLIRTSFEQQLESIRAEAEGQGINAEHFSLAADLLLAMSLSEDFEEFITLPGYRRLG